MKYGTIYPQCSQYYWAHVWCRSDRFVPRWYQHDYVMNPSDTQPDSVKNYLAITMAYAISFPGQCWTNQ